MALRTRCSEGQCVDVGKVGHTKNTAPDRAAIRAIGTGVCGVVDLLQSLS